MDRRQKRIHLGDQGRAGETACVVGPSGPSVEDSSGPGRMRKGRAELFGIERLEQHAESLASADRTIERPTRGRDLLPRVRENGREPREILGARRSAS